jgi:ribosome recycling factor
MGEDAKVALRKVRQAANDKIKKDEAVTEDEEKRLLDEVQKLIDKYNKEVDAKIAEKEEELMQV